MTARSRPLVIPLLALALVGARGALAEDAPAAAAGGAETGAAAPPSRVRASHRVDVIGPGERVDTVIERLRAARQPVGAGEARARERAPDAAGQRRDPERRGGGDDSNLRRDSDARRPDSERSRPPDGQRGPSSPASPERSGPPPDRPHHR